MRVLLFTLILLFHFSLHAEELCQKWEGEKLGELDPKKIDESSGLVSSRTMPDVYWTHNDSSGEARIFAINKKGKLLGEFKIKGADAIDWEDIAIAPCNQLGDFFEDENNDCLFIGDLGNNTASRQNFTFYVIDEPLFEKDLDKPIKRKVSLKQQIDFEYDKKARNSEAFFVADHAIWIFDKGNATDLFKLKINKEKAEHQIKRKKIEHITGADITADSTQFILRNSKNAYLYKIEKNETIGDAFERKPIVIDLKNEKHGEAIAWDGDRFLTTNEGEHTRLRRY